MCQGGCSHTVLSEKNKLWGKKSESPYKTNMYNYIILLSP